MKERPLPANLEAEKLIVGSLLSGHLPYQQAREVIGAEDFSIEVHRRVFAAVADLAQSGEAVNQVAVYRRLEERKQAESCGGLTYLAELQGDSVPINLTSYLRAVKEAALRRRAIQACRAAAEALWSGSERPPDILTRAERNLAELGREMAGPQPAPEFTGTSDRYRLNLPGLGIVLEVDRLRREHHELIGELAARCALPGARAVNGVLSIADFNLSSARARTERAKMLADRARTNDLDWAGILEEFCQRVLEADRAGQPAVDLREVQEPEPDDSIHVEGFRFPRRHPTILFGDGGSCKSYLALYLAGCLAQEGLRVGLADWELCGEDHRLRLRLLFGRDMPSILYTPCHRPLTAETDRLRRIARERALDYLMYDSVAYACDGPPEAAEVAGRYFRAVREIGPGSLHIAHVTKSEENDKRPFGSAFWHNSARSTWYVKAAEVAGDERTLDLGFFNRKSNLGPIAPPLGFTVTFSDGETIFRRSEVGDTPDLALKMTVTQRVTHLLRRGPLKMAEISEQLDIPLNTVSHTVNRHNAKGRIFIMLDGKLVGLRAR